MVPGDTLPRGRFIIIAGDWMPNEYDSVEAALSLAQREHQKQPATRFVVAQIVASVDPVITSTVTLHRF